MIFLALAEIELFYSTCHPEQSISPLNYIVFLHVVDRCAFLHRVTCSVKHIRWLRVVRFWCLLVSQKIPDSAGTPQILIALIVPVYDKLCCITALFGIFLSTDKHHNMNSMKLVIPLHLIVVVNSHQR